MENPDRIGVNIEVARKIYANAPDVFVEIKGDSFFSGKEAIKKAREVKEMVQALLQAGIDESMIELMGVRMEVSSGMISKSSSALYRLRLHLTKLDSLGDVLGAVTSKSSNISTSSGSATAGLIFTAMRRPCPLTVALTIPLPALTVIRMSASSC